MHQKIYNIIVFPGGTEIGLEIFKSLCQCKNIRLFSGGQDISNHAPYVFAKHFIIPPVYDSSWLTKFNRIITEQKIDYIFPAHDDVIVALAENQHRIKAKIVSSPLETCLITRFKAMTYKFFYNLIPVPKLYENQAEIQQYPVFAKPNKGQGSQDTHIIYSKEHLAQLLQQNKDYVITEYLPGEEYTIDCFSDREKGLLFCSVRQRVRTRHGISMNSSIIDINKDNILIKYAQAISRNIVLHGAWFFQVKKDHKGIYKLLEIAPRVPGTLALQRVRGVNLPLLSIYEQERIPIEIVANDVEVEIDRALINRYKHSLNYKTVYIDLDDTLIFNNKVNLNIIKFLYQCINKKISIILVTKHSGNLDETLKEYRLTEIFDKIIHIDKLAHKCDSIGNDNNSIFIDDSFSERQAISQSLKILTFDCSMIEMLLDDRE